jgi:pyrimidine operon attenuation protein/uracil phosphoribosyltransferase
MSTSDERQARPRGLTFLAKSQLLSADDVARALRRMAHEIIERNHSLGDVCVIGLQRGGEPFATRLTAILSELYGAPVPLGLLDVSFYRDDL